MSSSIKRLPKALSSDELDALQSVRMNPRDRALITTMSRCGLRVSEACGLTVENIHWTSETPSLRFTGKRDRERVVPMNLEVQDVLRTWLEARRQSDSPFVFCNLRNGKRLSRKTVWAALKRYAKRSGIRHVHPHMLRHTFGTDLADRDVPVERIRDLMGHASIETSSIYISVSAEQKKRSVEKIDRRPRWLRWWSRQRNRDYRFLGRSRKNLSVGPRQTVGRQDELHQLQQNLEKRIDTLLIGPVGVGKSHLLDMLKADHVLRIKNLAPVKQAVINIAEELQKIGKLRLDDPDQENGEREEARAQSLPANVGERLLDENEGKIAETSLNHSEERGISEEKPNPMDAPGASFVTDFEAYKQDHSRTSIQGWIQIVTTSVSQNEYVLIVDDLTDLSVSVGRLIDKLNRKFVIFAALHEVKKNYEKHFWKFDRVEVTNLPPAEAKKLIRQCTAGAEIEDHRMTETYVLQQSAGNPRAIIEIIDRLRKEPAITRSAVRDVSHTGARNQIDLTAVVVLLLLAVVAARFIARGMGSMDGYVLAGIGSAVLMGLRFFLYRFRR
jgi:hypothetical protein